MENHILIYIDLNKVNIMYIYWHLINIWSYISNEERCQPND